jgi:hypothetical protein
MKSKRNASGKLSKYNELATGYNASRPTEPALFYTTGDRLPFVNRIIHLKLKYYV